MFTYFACEPTTGPLQTGRKKGEPGRRGKKQRRRSEIHLRKEGRTSTQSRTGNYVGRGADVHHEALSTSSSSLCCELRMF